MEKVKNKKPIKKVTKDTEIDEYIGRLAAVIKLTYNNHDKTNKKRILNDLKELVDEQELVIRKAFIAGLEKK